MLGVGRGVDKNTLMRWGRYGWNSSLRDRILSYETDNSALSEVILPIGSTVLSANWNLKVISGTVSFLNGKGL